VNPYRSLVQALGTTRGFTWVAARVLPPLDARFAGRRRSVTSLGTGFPLCYLTTTGRKSGARRTVPLLFVADGERVVLFASNWGKPSHPAWALNLDATPAAEVTVDGAGRAMRARRATADEERVYWPRAQAMYPGYAGYRRRAGREIRVFVLEPAPSGVAS
jgi:deazaflavin-dependent oxidoreductase (nitroreductase family)